MTFELMTLTPYFIYHGGHLRWHRNIFAVCIIEPQTDFNPQAKMYLVWYGAGLSGWGKG